LPAAESVAIGFDLPNAAMNRFGIEASFSGKGRSEKALFSGNVQNPVQRLEAAAFLPARQNFSGSFPNSGILETTRHDASTEVDDASWRVPICAHAEKNFS